MTREQYRNSHYNTRQVAIKYHCEYLWDPRLNLQDLGSLILGLKTETLLTFTSDKLLSVLKALSKNKQASCQKGLRPPEANAIATKLWGFPEVVNWLNDVAPLLSCTPLLSVLPRIHLLALNASNTTREPWNTQQAEAIFNYLFSSNPNLVKQNFLSLGSLGQGVSCKVLQDRFRADPTPSSATNILAILRQQPRLLHTALKNCVIEGLYPFDFFTQLLQDFGVEIALSMSMSTFSKFSPGMMDTLRKMIVEKPSYFLVWPATKQLLLVDRMLQTLGMYTGMFTKEEFLSLGVMASFVADEVFIQVDRSFFIQNLHYIKSLCYSSSKMDIVSRILQEPAVFGSVKNWTQVTLSQVERFVFFLPVNVLQDIPLPLMTVGQIEKLFMSQRQWEGGVVGTFCSDQNDRAAIFSKQQFVLQFFLGFLTMSTTSLAPKVPTCEILRTTAPSAWTSGSLSSMPTSAFINCLELMGLDSFMASYQRSEVLKRVKKIFGPVSSFPPSLITQLGGIATALTADELSTLQLTDVRSISSLGAVSNWTSKQLTALFTTVLNATKKSASQLDSSTLVAMGYIVCGAKTTDINSFNNVEFSKAVLYLGQLKLPCSEDQMLALNALLTNPLAFGLISSWDTDVFIEIGVLAAGLPDMAMSALVKVQIDGISPAAISMILPGKFAVVFDQKQISLFSYEQAVAVTPQQIALMSDAQKAALAVVLTPWYGKPTGPGVRSLGSSLSHSPLGLMLGLLILLTLQFCPDR
nr:stereocilin [Nothobranchius furzeri]